MQECILLQKGVSEAALEDLARKWSARISSSQGSEAIPVEQLVDGLQEEIREKMAHKDLCITIVQVRPVKRTELPITLCLVIDLSGDMLAYKNISEDAFGRLHQIIEALNTAIPADAKLRSL